MHIQSIRITNHPIFNQSRIHQYFRNSKQSIHHQTRLHIAKNGPQFRGNKTGKQHRQIFIKTKHPERYVPG